MHDHTTAIAIPETGSTVLNSIRRADQRHIADRQRDARRFTLLALALLGLETAEGV